MFDFVLDSELCLFVFYYLWGGESWDVVVDWYCMFVCDLLFLLVDVCFLVKELMSGLIIGCECFEVLIVWM